MAIATRPGGVSANLTCIRTTAKECMQKQTLTRWHGMCDLLNARQVCGLQCRPMLKQSIDHHQGSPMKRTPLFSALAVAASAFAAGVAHSAVVSIDNVTASWTNDIPTVSITGNNTTAPKARWGTPATNSGQSGYDFDVATLPINFAVPPSPSDNNVIGTFKHINNPITGTSLSSITLNIVADVYVDSLLVGSGLNFNYGFSHWETPNGDNPCADGGTNGMGVNINGCADRVIATWLATSDDFEIDTGSGTDTYTLNVLGFSLNPDGSDPFSAFWTKEQNTNLAYLVANVTLRSELEPEEIPEPATLALVGMALAGVAAARRRKSAKA